VQEGHRARVRPHLAKGLAARTTDHSGGAVVPASGAAACASEVTARQEMEAVFGIAVAGPAAFASMVI